MVVASVTYVTMFNINSLVDVVSRIYDIKKRRIVKVMKADPNVIWKQRGQRFEVFRPKHENPQPSEWYVTRYALFNPLVLLGIRRRTEKHDQDTKDFRKASQAPKYPRFLNFFGRRAKAREPKGNDEGWVL